MPKRKYNIPAEVAKARARLAGLTARGAPADQLELARLALDSASARAAAQKWRTLPAADRMELARTLLTGGGDHAAT